MATVQDTFSQKCPVIVRSFGNRPARLCVVEVSGSLVIVSNDSGEASIRMRIRDVYAFSEALYRKLLAAFRQGDAEKLADLWSHAPPFAA